MSRPPICLSVTTFPPQAGGVATAAARLTRGLAPHYDVHVVVPDHQPGSAGVVESSTSDGVTVHRVFHDDPSSSPGQFHFRRVLQDLDERVRFRLFHGFFLTAAIPCVYVARRGQRPTIASPRGSDAMFLLEQPMIRTMLLAMLKSVTWIASVNQACLDRIAEDIAIDGRSSVIRSGIAPLAADEPRWSLDNGRRGVVGTVGEFRPVKDIPLLIRAYATVPPHLRRGLFLAGFFSDAEEASWSTTLIKELGVEPETTITGEFPRRALSTALSRLHVYVQSSANEGFPNGVLEAAVRGIPIVATAVGGMREVLDDGESALLAPHGDRDALGAAITRVLQDDQLSATLSAGAARLAARWSHERETSDWLALYDQLVRDAPPVISS